MGVAALRRSAPRVTVYRLRSTSSSAARNAVNLPPLPEAYWAGEHHARAPRALTADLAELVGYFMGDGSLHSKGIRLCVADGDFDVVERLERLGKELLRLAGRTSRRRQGYTEVAFHSVRLVEWWEACGFAKRQPREGHAGKGWVAAHPRRGPPHATTARCTPRSSADCSRPTAPSPRASRTGPRRHCEFSYDVQSLLLASGYPTTRKFDVSGRGARRSQCCVCSTRRTTLAGSTEVGFISDRKQARVLRSEGRQAARQDHIPLTRELVDRLAPENDRLRKVLLLEVARNRVSRRLATELFDRTGDTELAHLLAFFYDTVTSAELGDEELTFDLSVPDNVTYVANGFVSHNTIGLMMDCDTTGIEPDLALTKAKKLVGGGTMFIVNQTIPRALRKLGYSDDQVDAIVAVHRRAQDDHRCTRLQPRAPAGVRVLDGRQHDPLHGSREDDGVRRSPSCRARSRRP